MKHNVLFSVNEYDCDGDLAKEGVYLHFGETKIRVADHVEEFDKFVDQVMSIKNEIEENYL